MEQQHINELFQELVHVQFAQTIDKLRYELNWHIASKLFRHGIERILQSVLPFVNNNTTNTLKIHWAPGSSRQVDALCRHSRVARELEYAAVGNFPEQRY